MIPITKYESPNLLDIFYIYEYNLSDEPYAIYKYTRHVFLSKYRFEINKKRVEIF